ncbi:hypothetical protein CI102_15109 [Trichoderma harzianum]|nr:hypothetical protein CI102_15109 [Trichoderma harzianum]
MSYSNTPTTNFIRYVLPRFPVMPPQAVYNLIQYDDYFRYLITLLNELFIIPVQIYAGSFGFSTNALETLESRLVEDCYLAILTELRLRILTGIYFLQGRSVVEARPHIERAIALVQEHKASFYTSAYGEFRMAHLALLRTCIEYDVDYPKELAPWKQVDHISRNGLDRCLKLLPWDMIHSIKQSMKILIMFQRRDKFREICSSRLHSLSIEDIREQLYEHVYRTRHLNDSVLHPGSCIYNISQLSDMHAEIELLWPLFEAVSASPNANKEIRNLHYLLNKIISYINQSQLAYIPDRLQRYVQEYDYLGSILHAFDVVGPVMFYEITRLHVFDVAMMVYKFVLFTHSTWAADR